MPNNCLSKPKGRAPVKLASFAGLVEPVPLGWKIESMFFGNAFR